jgi:hypothetical protein
VHTSLQNQTMQDRLRLKPESGSDIAYVCSNQSQFGCYLARWSEVPTRRLCCWPVRFQCTLPDGGWSAPLTFEAAFGAVAAEKVGS